MDFMGFYAQLAVSAVIAVSALVYAIRRADALAWCLALVALLSTAVFAASHGVALTAVTRDPEENMAISSVLGSVSDILRVLFGLTLSLVLVRDSKLPSNKRIDADEPAV